MKHIDLGVNANNPLAHLAQIAQFMAFFDLVENDISSDDITQLLSKAEQRLRASATIKRSPVYLHKSADDSKTPQQLPPQTFPRLEPEKVIKPYVDSNNGVARAEPSLLLTRDQKLPEKSVLLKKVITDKIKSNKVKKPDAGPEWFYLPRTELTPILKRELQILKMRSVLDPKRHYKRDDSKALASEFSQIGTIIQGSTEFFNSRLLNKDRKNTIAGEILAAEECTGRFRKKYDQLQIAKASGQKSFYKNLKYKRSGGVKKR